MATRKTSATELWTENSFSALAKAACASRPTNSVNETLLANHQNSTNARFTGMAGPIATVCEKLLSGWPEGVEAMRKAGEGLKLPPVPSIRRRVRWGAQGDELDIHAVRNGKLERAWRSAPRQLGVGPGRVRIVVDINAPWNIDKSDLHWRGAAGLALAKALTGAGYNVQIDAFVWLRGLYNDSDWENQNNHVLVTVKGYQAPLNLSSLAGIIAHPASFRRVFFSYLCAKGTRSVRGSLGSVHSPSAHEVKQALSIDDQTTFLYIPNTLLSEQLANQWIRTSVTAIVGGK